MDQIHITNGDSAADLIRASCVEGEVLAWRDTMHHGPFPANLSLEESAEVRARYLAGNELDINVIRQDFCERNDKLRSASHCAQIILWFEHDLLDQLQILEVLYRLSEAHFDTTNVSIICINQYPGVPGFRGLGQLNCAQIESLLPTRVAVTDSQLSLARRVWDAFRANNPTSLQHCMQDDLSALPFLKPALHRHFQEYPWKKDGLTRTERQLLTLACSGVDKPGSLFIENMALENALYIGDWHTYKILARLVQTDTHLLRCAPEDTFLYPPVDQISLEQFSQQRLTVSNAAQRVLSNRQNARSLITRDEWLGGVQLKSDATMWMWDDESSHLVLEINS